MKASPSKKRKSILHKFYLISPRQNLNAGLLAEKLLSLKPVEEVHLTDGDFGFIVKARFSRNEEPKNVTRFIERHIDQKYGKVVSYYQYRK